MALLTRFASHHRRQDQLVWKSPAIRVWESCFSGKFRLGWLSYNKIHEHEELTKQAQNIEDEQERIGELKSFAATRAEKRCVRWPATGRVFLCLRGPGFLTPLWCRSYSKQLDKLLDELYELEDAGLKFVTKQRTETIDAVEFPGAPSTYRPGLGGASVKGSTLTVTDSSGAELLKVDNIDDNYNITKLLGPKPFARLGTLFCGWT